MTSDKATQSGDKSVEQELRESVVDFAVVEGDDGDVFVKTGREVVLLDRIEARILADEIYDTLAGNNSKSDAEER